MEHRWGRRVPVNMGVSLRCALFSAQPAVMRDASMSGAFIETKLFPPLFSRVQIAFVISHEGRCQRYDLLAHVARHALDGIGIEWAELAPLAIRRQLELREARPTPRPDSSISNPQML